MHKGNYFYGIRKIREIFKTNRETWRSARKPGDSRVNRETWQVCITIGLFQLLSAPPLLRNLGISRGGGVLTLEFPGEGVY